MLRITRPGHYARAGILGELMETALTPLEFARRTRLLYSDREAVVDGLLRLTYAQFFDRCDRWSARSSGSASARRSRRLHRAEHARTARIVLRRAADRRGARADQLPADSRRLRLHHQSQRRHSRLRACRLPGGGRQHSRPASRRRALRRARRRARRLARLRERCWPRARPSSSGRRSPRPIC